MGGRRSGSEQDIRKYAKISTVSVSRPQLLLFFIKMNKKQIIYFFLPFCLGSGLKFQATIKWLSLIVGPIGATAALFVDYQKRQTVSLQVTKVSPVKSSPQGIDFESRTSTAITQELKEKERF